MKKSFRYLSILMLGLFMTVFSQSCTDLDEEIFSAVPADDFLTTDEEFISALGAAYSSFGGFIGEPWSLAEVASDEVVVPTRGADWFDNGNWQRIHAHSYEPGDDRVTNSWPVLFGGVNNANRLLFQFEALGGEGAQAFLSELKGLRGLFYFFLLDVFGNVPIVTDFGDETAPSNNADFQAGRTAVYNFTLSELEGGVDDLTKDVVGAYGRINFYAGQGLIAKLYLNSGVYLGTGTITAADLQKALDAVNVIINSGAFALEGNYFDNFSADNAGSRENILVIVFDQVFAGGMNIAQRTLHYQSQETFNLGAQPWNGYASLSEFYESYIDQDQNPGPQGNVVGLDPLGSIIEGTLDARNGNFIVGPQFASDGVTRLIDASADADDPDGQELTFTPFINEFEPFAWRQSGARIGKYQFELGAEPDMNNDYPILRYADILLMKAEILWRMNPSSQEALDLVNTIRDRAGVDPFTSLTEDLLLAERGREMAFEYWRRNDLLRFPGVNGGVTRYNDPWQFKGDGVSKWPDGISPVSANVFPIPTAQIEANPLLNQNPGF